MKIDLKDRKQDKGLDQHFVATSKPPARGETEHGKISQRNYLGRPTDKSKHFGNSLSGCSEKLLFSFESRSVLFASPDRVAKCHWALLRGTCPGEGAGKNWSDRQRIFSVMIITRISVP